MPPDVCTASARSAFPQAADYRDSCFSFVPSHLDPNMSYGGVSPIPTHVVRPSLIDASILDRLR